MSVGERCPAQFIDFLCRALKCELGIEPQSNQSSAVEKSRPSDQRINFAKAVIEAASRRGIDGKGRLGLNGYLTYVQKRHPRQFLKLLSVVLDTKVFEALALSERPDEHEELRRKCRPENFRSLSLEEQMATLMAFIRSTKPYVPDPKVQEWAKSLTPEEREERLTAIVGPLEPPVWV
jgi:hypothetical protein